MLPPPNAVNPNSRMAQIKSAQTDDRRKEQMIVEESR
jgi:hypothetical protein